MDEFIVAAAHSIAKLFSNEFRFELPYFQRGYAWQQDHVRRLLADVLRMADGAGGFEWYALGGIILAKRPDDPEAWVADGHQRLISLTIMIAILRDLERDADLKARLQACIADAPAGGAPRYRLATAEAASDCLADYVQADGSTTRAHDDLDDELSESAANVIRNRDELQRQIAALSRERRRRLALFLLDRCILVVTQVRDQRAASLLFSTLHDTGLKPTTVDLFKAQVLSQIASDHREACRTIWERLEASLGQGRFDTLLGHIVLLRTRAPLRRSVHEALRDHFELDEATAARDFVERHLAPIGDHFVALCLAPLGAGTLSDPVRRRLQYLGWVRNHDTWTVPVLRWLEHMGAGHVDTARFMQAIEALAWVQLITTPDQLLRTNRYLKISAEIDEGRALEAGASLAVTPAEQAEVRRILSAPNYTNRPYRFFLLLRANAALDGDDALHLYPEDPTVEHIFPRRPGPRSRWLTDFRGEDARRFRSAFGNLTLLTRNEQNEARNLDFDVKRPILARSAFALSRRLSGRGTWRPEEIGRSTDEMIDILMRSWGLA